MYLIIGLGNPEPEYKSTRHNIGFEVINKIAYDNNISLTKSKHRSLIGEGIIGGKKVILAKPQTYMNLSGEAVIDLMKFYKPFEDEIIVVYDDITLPVGDIKIRKKGSSGGHNGIKNIILELDTDEFFRIKVGIGEKPKSWILADYVLSKFTKDEFDNMVTGVTKATDAITMFLKSNIDETMNKFNVKSPK